MIDWYYDALPGEAFAAAARDLREQGPVVLGAFERVHVMPLSDGLDPRGSVFEPSAEAQVDRVESWCHRAVDPTLPSSATAHQSPRLNWRGAYRCQGPGSQSQYARGAVRAAPRTGHEKER